MGKRSRDKGANFERWVAKELKHIFSDAKRGIQYRDGGKEASDVSGAGPFHIECKHGKKPNPGAALEQAENDSGEGKLIAAIVKDDRKSPFVVMLWSDWLELVEDAAKEWG